MIKLQQNWGVLLSQTGTEVINIAKELRFLPSLIVTNNYNKIDKVNLEILRENGVDIKIIPFRPKAEDYLIEELLSKKIITLHGYLRIIPLEFFRVYAGKVYNGHPALIYPEYYPELKGKDPQERVWAEREKYPYIGSVVHECIPALDEGPIITGSKVKNIAKSKDHLYLIQRKLSLEAWKAFFKQQELFL